MRCPTLSELPRRAELGSTCDRDLSRWNWNRKRKAYASLKTAVVAPSHWLASCARHSSLFKDQDVHVIPYGLDVDVFRPVGKDVARRLHHLPVVGAKVVTQSNDTGGISYRGPCPARSNLASWPLV